jgi:preprotein translocase subunit Sss1
VRTPAPPDLASRVALAGYIIGAAGFAIAVIVIVLMSR